MRCGRLFLTVVLVLGLCAVADAQTTEQAPKPAATMKKAVTDVEAAWLRVLQAKRPEKILTEGFLTADEAAIDAAAWKKYTAELRKLIEKNREWYDYWAKQKDRAGDLLAVYNQAIAEMDQLGLAGPERETLAARREAIRAWDAVCTEKLTIQDNQLNAIETTLAAYEKRMAAEETLTRTIFEDKAAFRHQLHQLNLDYLVSLLEADQLLVASCESARSLLEKQIEIAKPFVEAAGADSPWKNSWKNLAEAGNAELPEIQQEKEVLSAAVAQLVEAKTKYEDNIHIGDLEKEIRVVEDKWHRHLMTKTPQIHHFTPPDENKLKTREDRWTYRVFELSEKAKSNRAWYDFWKEQLNRTNRLLTVYQQTIAQVGDSRNTAAAKARMQSHLAGLQEWKALCEKKMANQDKYLEAIEMEKEAFESRIELAKKEAAAQEQQGTKSTKSSSGKGVESWLPTQEVKPTAYSKYKVGLQALRDNLTEQQNKLAETENEKAFSIKLVEAAKVLLASYRADAELAGEELAIAEKQAGGQDETDEIWLSRWKEIKEKTTAKVADLEKGTADQEDTVRQLDSEVSYLGERIKIIQGRASDLEERIAVHKTGIYRALALMVRDIALTRGLTILAYLLVGWLAIRFIRKIGKIIIHRAAERGVTTNTQAEKTAGTLVGVFSSMGRAIVYLVLGLLILSTMGVNVGPLMGAFAIFGLAISFGSQNLVKDVVNGFFMLLENQVSVGDAVAAGGVDGWVEKVTLRRIVLRDQQGTTHNIPHGQIAILSNKTQAWSRALVRVGVGYRHNLREVFQILNEAGQKMFEDPEWKPLLMEAPHVWGVEDLGDNAISLRIWAKVAPAQQFKVEPELYLRLKEACDANDIEIPFPQRVVELKGFPVLAAQNPRDAEK